MVDTGRFPILTSKQIARFKVFALPHWQVMLRTALFLTHRQPDAEDLVQEAMLKAMKAIDQFKEGTDAKAWLMTILWRVHIDAQRSAMNRSKTISIDQTEMDLSDRSRPVEREFDARQSSPEALMERFGDQEVIEALKSLPDEIRWTLLLVDIEQLENAAAATVLEVPVGTIKSRAHRGRAMLYDKLHEWAKDRGWVTSQGDKP